MDALGGGFEAAEEEEVASIPVGANADPAVDVVVGLTLLGTVIVAAYELAQPCEAKQQQPAVIPKGKGGKRAAATAAAASPPPPTPPKGHTKNARNSTRGKHEEGDTRRQTDQGGEKGDARRD